MKRTLIALLFLVGFMVAPALAQDNVSAEPPAGDTVAVGGPTEDPAAPAAEPAATLAPVPASVQPTSATTAAAEISALGQVMRHVLEVLGAIALLALIWLKKRLITYFEKKTQIDIPDRQEAMVDIWAERAVNYAREKAHQLLKEKDEKMTGPAKLEAALSFGLALAEEHGYTTLAKEKLTKYIEAKLGAGRAE